MKIIKGTTEHLTEIAVLFNQYRIFYNQNSDIEAATDFISNRIANNESTI